MICILRPRTKEPADYLGPVSKVSRNFSRGGITGTNGAGTAVANIFARRRITLESQLAQCAWPAQRRPRSPATRRAVEPGEFVPKGTGGNLRGFSGHQKWRAASPSDMG